MGKDHSPYGENDLEGKVEFGIVLFARRGADHGFVVTLLRDVISTPRESVGLKKAKDIVDALDSCCQPTILPK